jgi:hypothetical protein
MMDVGNFFIEAQIGGVDEKEKEKNLGADGGINN